MKDKSICYNCYTIGPICLTNPTKTDETRRLIACIDCHQTTYCGAKCLKKNSQLHKKICELYLREYYNINSVYKQIEKALLDKK